MRILLVDLESAWRGGQSQALLALKGFRAAGHEVALVAVDGGALAERARTEGVSVHAVRAGARRLDAARAVRRMLSKRFDIVHANEPHALTAVWLAGAHRQVALVASRRIALPLGRSALALKRYRAAHRIIAVSEFVAASVRASGIPSMQLEVVYDGVELPRLPSQRERRTARREWGVSEDDILLGCVGYLLPEKGQRFALGALAALRNSLASMRLILAGDGPCRSELEEAARGLGLDKSVIFAGHVADIAQVYRALDVFVFPSHEEPLGSSLLEAMAWGLPAVARESGGVREVIRNGSDGLLVYEANQERVGEGLAKAVQHILEEPGMGASARRRIEESFTAERMVQQMLLVYQSVL